MKPVPIRAGMPPEPVAPHAGTWIEVEDRILPGHCGGDTALGPTGKGRVATLVERTSRFVVAFALPSKVFDPLAEGLLRTMEGILCRSITVDNGKEFARHQ